MTERAGRRLVLLALVLLPPQAAFIGCGSKATRSPVYPAEGKVLVRGKPAAGAVVVLVPVGDVKPDAARPRGVVGADGTFKLGTYAAEDGAPAGEYVITVRWQTPQRKAPDEEGAPLLGPRPDRLAGRYSNPQTSGLRARVEKAVTVLGPLNLQ